LKTAKNCKKLQKIALFSSFSVQIVLEMAQNAGHYRQICRFSGLHKNCKKLQKIALFLEKTLKIGGFGHFWPKSWDICGT